MNTLLIALPALLLLVVVAGSAVMLAQLRRLRLVEPQFQGLSPLDVPEDARERLAPGLDLLLALGFVQPIAQRVVAQHVNGQPVEQHLLTLTHPKVPAAAFLSTTVVPDGPRTWSIHFVSRTREGQTLLTRNRASFMGPLPLRDVRTHDVWLPDWPAVWKSHAAAMRGMAPRSSQWAGMTSEAWAAASADADHATFHVYQLNRQLVWAGDGAYRVSWRTALAMLGRAWAVAHHSWRPMAADRQAAKTAPPSQATLVSAYEHHARQHRAGGWSAGAKWLLFFASAGLAALSFGLNMDLQSLAALLLVLLVHEGGHLAAMRWAGYQDLKVFFLPFLGAAVSGRHEQPTARQELVVLFAGPLPGLVLGLAALLYAPADLLGSVWGGFGHACALLAVILNAFNLLPLHPLDGGKIFEILLLGRWPGLAFAGRVLGLLALAALALVSTGDTTRAVLLAVVLLMALGLPQHWREARLARALRAQGRHAGLARPAALKAIFSTLAQLGYSRLAWPNQKQLVDALLPATLRPRLTRTGRAAGLAFYAFSLALPLLGALAWGLQTQRLGPDEAAAQEAAGRASAQATAQAAAQAEAAGRAQQSQWLASRQAELQALQQRVAAAPGAAAQWALLLAEGDLLAEELGQHGAVALPAAEALLRQADTLAAAPGAAPAWRAQAALWRADAEPDAARRLEHLRRALAAYGAPDTSGPAAAASAPAAAAATTRAPAAELAPLLRAAAQWAQEAPADAQPAPAAEVDRVLALAADTASPQDLLPLQTHKVDLLLAAGDHAGALDLANAVFDRALPRGDTTLLVAAAGLLVDTHLATGGPAAALKALDTALPLLDLARSPGRMPAEPLRRFGLWVAEAAQRPDWQREQVGKLAPPPVAPVPQSLTDRALLWLLAQVQGEPTTLMDVDRAHWAGNPGAAREAAQRLLARNPRFVAQGWPGDGRSALAQARVRIQNDVRLAVYKRYGLPVKLGR